MKKALLTTTNKDVQSYTLTAQKAAIVLPHLTQAQREFIEAGLQPPIGKRPAAEAMMQLTDIVNMAFSISGQRPDNGNEFVIVNELYRKLQETYPNCTIEEIRTAIRNGVYDEYGEYYGLNVKTFVFFIRQYLFSEQRKAAKIAFESARKKQELPQAQEPHYWEDTYWTQERTSQWQEITNSAYRWFRNEAIFRDFVQEGSFWLLHRIGKIKISQEYKNELQVRAKQVKRTELVKNDAKKTSDVVRNELEALNCIPENPDMERQVFLIAKRLAVLDYFSVLQKKGIATVFETEG